MNHIFSMDSYAVYVWTAYFITFFVLGLNVFLGYREKSAVKKTLQEFLSTHTGDYAGTILKPAVKKTVVTKHEPQT